MRVLIPGGSGLIGRALTTDLAADGHEVVLLSRTPQRVSGLPKGARAEAWDGRTAEGWLHLIDGVDAIVNLAGEGIGDGRWSAKRKRRIRDSRVHAGEAVVAAVKAARNKPRVVIQASGIGYYGPRQETEITEEENAGQDWLAQVAVQWEASTAAVEEAGVRRAVIRTGVVLSRGDGAFDHLGLELCLVVLGRDFRPHLAEDIQRLRIFDGDSRVLQ